MKNVQSDIGSHAVREPGFSRVCSIRRREKIRGRFEFTKARRAQRVDPSLQELDAQTGSSVGRTVVDDDEFKIAERLIEDALDRLCDVFLGIIYRHHDGNDRDHARVFIASFKNPLARQEFLSPITRQPLDERAIGVTLVRIVRDWVTDPMRQSPEGKGVWGDLQFTVDPVSTCDYLAVINGAPERVEVECAKERVWSFIQEPPTGENRTWHRHRPYAFRTFTSDGGRNGPAYVHSQPATMWLVNRSYDFLIDCEPPQKTRGLSWITSDKSYLRGHRLRMNFLERARRDLDFDLFGRSFRPLEDKWNGLAPYRYSLAVENHRDDYYWTEKIADCYLAWTMPIYYGCRRISEYFPAESFIQIDITRSDVTAQIEAALADDPWPRRLEAIAEARRLVLRRYQLFPFLASQIEQFESAYGSFAVKGRVVIPPLNAGAPTFARRVADSVRYRTSRLRRILQAASDE